MVASPSIWRPILARPRTPTVKFLSITLCPTARRATAVTHIHLRAFSSPPSASPPPHEPLRILFCGSDAFSCASLQALHDEMQRQKQQPAPATEAPGRIASLDVVVRPAKRTGRGHSQTTDSPVKTLATQLGLAVHERDTFTGWSPPPTGASDDVPAPINMIVAVSFGLFVPKRLLRAARYGGLNVHPSLLPDLYGAAPIEHAVLLGRPRTGVTVQTLDETTFDGGRRLLQGPQEQTGPATNETVGVAVGARTTAADLYRVLAPIGAGLLVEVLQRGLYLPEHASVNVSDPSVSPPAPVAAPKLAKADRQILWQGQPETTSTITAADIDRQARALGELWTHLEVLPSKKAKAAGDGPPMRKRAILDDIDLAPCPEALEALLQAVLVGNSRDQVEGTDGVQTATFIQESAGTQRRLNLPFVVDGESVVIPVGVDLQDKQSPSCLRIGSIKIEGDKTKPAARAMAAFAAPFASKGDGGLDGVAWDVVLKK